VQLGDFGMVGGGAAWVASMRSCAAFSRLVRSATMVSRSCGISPCAAETASCTCRWRSLCARSSSERKAATVRCKSRTSASARRRLASSG
jgi:hypothetical protein